MPRRLGGDHLGLAGDRQLRVRQRRRLHPHSGRHQVARRRLPQPQPQRLDLDEAVGLREAIILQAAETFRPDVFIVDKEPTGFRGEVIAGARIPAAGRLPARARHPRRHGRAGASRTGMGAQGRPSRRSSATTTRSGSTASRTSTSRSPPSTCRRRSRRASPIPAICGARSRQTPSLVRYPKITKQPFILVTTGGGGDGDDLIDWVISAYEADPQPRTCRPLILFGPFVNRDQRRSFLERIARQPKLDAIAFDTKIEHLMEKADGDRRDGRLQHVLRDPVLRQARPDRAAHAAPPRAIYPRRRGRAPRPRAAC